MIFTHFCLLLSKTKDSVASVGRTRLQHVVQNCMYFKYIKQNFDLDMPLEKPTCDVVHITAGFNYRCLDYQHSTI